MAQRPTTHHFVALDGLRGVAAFMVALYHADIFIEDRPPSGYLAVDLFFCLSGFVIAHSYGRRLRLREISFRQFVRGRVVRLYPLYFLGLALGAAFLSAQKILGNSDFGVADLVISAGFNLFYMPAPGVYAGDSPFPFNIPQWSMFFELAVNFVYAALISYFMLRRWFSVVVLAAVAMVLTIWYFGSADVGSSWLTFAGGFPRVTLSFALGVGIYQARTASAAAFSRSFLPCCAIVVVVLLIPECIPHKPVYDLACIVFVFPAIIWLASSAKLSPRLVLVATILGNMSYPMYMLHVPLFGWLHAVSTHVFGVSQPTTLVAIFLVCTPLLAAVSVAAERYYDRPVRRWLQSHVPAFPHRVRTPAP